MNPDVSFPNFYDAERVGTLYAPDTVAAIRAGNALDLPAAEQDQPRVALMLVDPQVDFIHRDGTLSVPGAVEDTRRTIEWIFSNVSRLTQIAASLDSHVPNQIFYPTWWIGKDGNPPAPFTPISAEQVKSGIWRPLFEIEWSKNYVETLERRAKKQLMIWPYHTMIGSPGHAVTPALYEAIAYHSAARRAQPRFVTKGTIPKTEHYSLFEPEVQVPDEPGGALNRAFIEWLVGHDLIYVAGQAKSHCVLESMNSLLRQYPDQPQVVGRIRVLMDCTSSVQHPVIDFEAIAEAAFQGFAELGVRLVKSTDPIG